MASFRYSGRINLISKLFFFIFSAIAFCEVSIINNKNRKISIKIIAIFLLFIYNEDIVNYQGVDFMKNKIFIAFVSSLLIISTSNAQDFQFTDKKIYDDYKIVEVCGGIAEIHLNQAGEVLNKENKIKYPRLAKSLIKSLKETDDSFDCTIYKSLSKEELKKNNYYYDGLFFKH